MFPRLALAACVAVLACALPCRAAPTADQIAQWVKQLGDDDFTVRETASKRLWEAGKAAEPALRRAVKEGDAEVVSRARAILEKFKLGIFPDTPAKIVELIDRFRSGDAGVKQGAIKDLMAQGAKGYAALVRLIAAEEDAELRRNLQQQIVREAPRVAGTLLAEGDYAVVEDLLENGVTADAAAALQAYAAYCLVRGRVGDKIDLWLARETKREVEARQASRVLAYLYRAKGDREKAWARAKQCDDKRLLVTVATEKGDWDWLADNGVAAEGLEGIEALGYQAAYDRLAGRTDAFERRVEELVKFADDKPGEDSDHWFSAEALLLVERPQEAVKVLLKTKSQVNYNAFEVLAAQGRFRAAFKLLEAERRADKDPFWLELAKVRTLYRLGDTAGTRRLCEKLGDEFNQPADHGAHVDLIGLEYRLGMKEEAFAHLAAALRTSGAALAANPGAFGQAFPGRGEQALAWWRFLSEKYPAKGEGLTPQTEAMAELRRVMDGKVTGKDLAALARAAAEKAGRLSPEERGSALVAFADACLAAGLDDPGLKLLEEAAAVGATPAPLLRLGDHFAARKKWDEAAKRYALAWEKEPRNPLPLYLRGGALAQAGKAAEGKKLMEAAELLPLGDEETRNAFAEALAARGHAEAARRQYEVIARTADKDSWYFGQAQHRLIPAARARGEHLAVADWHQQTLLRLLKTNTGFLETESYIAVPYALHLARARGLLAAGKVAEALKEAEAGQALRPLDDELPIALVPGLEKGGHKKEADAIYERAAGAHEALLKEHPKSAWGHNGLAWLAARCRRQLDVALKHAEKAVELAPDRVAYLDTLAEVHFQRGDKDKAIDAMKKCLALEPGSAFYQRQLKRYEAGDPKAEVPEP